MAVMKAKVPAALATGIICLLLGGGVGAVTVWAAVGKMDPQAKAAPSEDEGKGADPGSPNGKAKGAGPMGGGSDKKSGGGDKKGGGAARGPNPKTQLAQLVGKLDVLTTETLHIELTTEQKKQAKELLADLAEKEAITDEEAKAKFEALLKLLEPNKKPLEDAGFRWPSAGGMGGGGGGGGGPSTPPPNPFKTGTGDNAERLKSLQTTLGK
jgi:hypothetical protein